MILASVQFVRFLDGWNISEAYVINNEYAATFGRSTRLPAKWEFNKVAKWQSKVGYPSQ
jgi:hypothetical protein